MTSRAVSEVSPNDVSLGVQAAAAFVMLKPRRIQELVVEGFIAAPVKGRYRLADVVQGYVRSLREERKDASRVAGENRVRDARAREIEQRIALREAERSGTFMRVEEHFAIMEELVGMVRSEFGGLPGRLTRDPAKKREAEDEVDATFHRVADLCAKRAAELDVPGATYDVAGTPTGAARVLRARER